MRFDEPEDASDRQLDANRPNDRFRPIAVIRLVSNAWSMTDEQRDPLEKRAADLRRMTPGLTANVRLYSTADGGKKMAARPGWGCPCMVSQQQPVSGYDGWPVLEEPLYPGEQRVAVPFVFLSPEGAEAMRQASHFYLWEGKFIGEATVVS